MKCLPFRSAPYGRIAMSIDQQISDYYSKLLKRNAGIRGIATGTAFRRLVASCFARCRVLTSRGRRCLAEGTMFLWRTPEVWSKRM